MMTVETSSLDSQSGQPEEEEEEGESRLSSSAAVVVRGGAEVGGGGAPGVASSFVEPGLFLLSPLSMARGGAVRRAVGEWDGL